MERLLISQLLKWKDSHGRKPLILEGARQVGKTWLLKEFDLYGRLFKIRIKIWYKKWCYIGVFKLLIFNTLIYKIVL